MQVIKYLVSSFNIIDSIDNQGNTALHVAAYRGQLSAVEALMLLSPSSMYSKNNVGETFLHMAVTGFQNPIFRRVELQIELMKQLLRKNLFHIDEIINAQNHEGRTALHLAIIGSIHTDLVELLMTAPYIDVNIRDNNGMTPLDLLKQRPRSASSEILTRQLISAGGIFSCQDYSARRIIASHIRMRSIGNSPGSTFRIPDSEILVNMVSKKGSDACGSVRVSTDSVELSKHEFPTETRSPKDDIKPPPANDAAKGLKRLFHWPKMKKRKPKNVKKTVDEISVTNSEGIPLSLRQRYSSTTPSPVPNNKRTLSVRSNAPSPTTAKKKFASGLVHGVMQAMPHLNAATRRSRSSSFSKSPVSPHISADKQKGVYIENYEAEASCSTQTVDDGTPNVLHKPAFVYKRPLINQICFGASGKHRQRELFDQSVLSVA